MPIAWFGILLLNLLMVVCAVLRVFKQNPR